MNSNVCSFTEGRILELCPACASRDISPHCESFDYHYGIDGLFSTYGCLNCGSVFMNPMPSANDLSVLYPDDYYSYQPPVLEGALKRFMRHFFRYPRVYSFPKFKKPGMMVDVGCGAGHYLLQMRAKGWSVYGAELSKGAAEAGRRAGLDIRGGELHEAGFESAMFDFVRSNHSFEHMPDPDIVLSEMHRILKNDGRLFVGIPNYDGAWPKIFGKYWWNFGLPVHTVNYTRKGVVAALERNGFLVEKIVHNSDYSGLSGSIQIALNAKRGIRKSSGKIYSSKILRMPMHYASKLMDALGRGDCIEVIAIKRSAMDGA